MVLLFLTHDQTSISRDFFIAALFSLKCLLSPNVESPQIFLTNADGWMVLWYVAKYNGFAWCSCFLTGTSTLGPTLCAHSVVFFSIIIIIIIKFPLSWWEMRRKIVADVELEIYLWTWKCVSEQRCNPK